MMTGREAPNGPANDPNGEAGWTWEMREGNLMLHTGKEWLSWPQFALVIPVTPERVQLWADLLRLG